MLPDDPDTLPAAWARIDAGVRARVTDATYHLYLASLRPRSLDPGRLEVVAPTATGSWVAERFGGLLAEVASEVLAQPTAVVVAGGGAPASRGAPDRGDSPTASGPRGAERLNPKYTFEQLVIGTGNRLAHAAALAVAELPGQAYNPLFLYGPPGVGKTHLLHAIGNYLEAHGEALSVRLATAETFTAEFVDAVRARSVETFKARYRSVDVLLVDDVQFLERKARTEEEFFHTFNALHEVGSQLVLSSDRRPRDLDALEDRLRERFEAGLLCDVEPPDLAMRLAILAKRVELDDLAGVQPAALEVLADRMDLTVRALEGALIRAVAHASLLRRPLDAELAAEIVERLHPDAPAPPLSVLEIQRATAAAYGIGLDELLSASRTPRVAWPRQVAMHLARELTEHSLPALGREFAGRSHTTVLHALRRTVQRLAVDNAARDEVQALQDGLVRRADPAR